MLSLSPAKILVVLVIALIVLGPEKLPGVARSLGAAWGDLRRFRTRLESEVRGVFPDLPPAHEVAQAVRSPLAFLDRLADEHERTSPDGPVTVNGAGQAAPDTGPPDGGAAEAPPSNGSTADAAGSNGAAHNEGGPGGFGDEGSTASSAGGEQRPPFALDDPSMN